MRKGEVMVFSTWMR